MAAKMTKIQLLQELENCRLAYADLEANLASTVEVLKEAQARVSFLEAELEGKASTQVSTPDRALACFDRASRALEGLGIQDPTWGPLCMAERTPAGFRMWIRNPEYRRSPRVARAFLAQVAVALHQQGRVTGFSRGGYLWWRSRGNNELPSQEG